MTGHSTRARPRGRAATATRIARALKVLSFDPAIQPNRLGALVIGKLSKFQEQAR